MSDAPDLSYHVIVYAPPPPGWDPDTPYTEVQREGWFEVRKSLTTSEFIITDPDGTEHTVEQLEGMARIMGDWVEG